MRLFTNTRFILSLLLCLFMNARTEAQSVVAAGYTFNATTKPYTYLSGGTPINYYLSSTLDFDDGYTTVPLGFTFTFCGNDYTDVTVCANGWLRFGTGLPTSAAANYNYNATTGGSGIEPAVYALYEDVSGTAGSSSYQLSGTSGSYVFTWECKNWLWDYAATTPCVSYQVKLYQATGIIEVLYKQEPGSVALNTSGGATIGILNSSTDWQVLNSVGSAPTSSTSTWTYTLSSVPATNQCYQWDPGPACAGPTGYSVSSVNSKGASFTWTAVAGSLGYEYVIDQAIAAPTATPTATATNTGSKTGLLPATTYYVHLRTSCGVFNKSKWSLYTFTTLADCSKPVKFINARVDTGSADITWDAVPAATYFQFIVDNSSVNPPANTSAALTTSSNSLNLTGLQEDMTYYVHIRTLCPGSDSSVWVIDSFHTPIPCRKPALQLSGLSDSRAVIYWSPVKSAVLYEYYFGAPGAPPAFGTPIGITTIQQPFLSPNTDYNMHVRCSCTYQNINTISPWATLEFTTMPPLTVSNVNGSETEITVYPNPVKDVLNISFAAKPQDGAYANVVDMHGRVIKHFVIDAQTTSLYISDIASGIYILEYNDGKGGKKQIKITKN